MSAHDDLLKAVELANAEHNQAVSSRDATIASQKARIAELEAKLAPAPSLPANAPLGPKSVNGWDLKFFDDFTNGLSPGWRTGYPWGPEGSTNDGNNEEQWYLPTNCSVANGRLSLTARRETTLQSVKGKTKTFNYTSGMVCTGPHGPRSQPSTFAQKFGCWEVTAQLPAGQGLWPAIWLLPPDLSWPPEIDILEALMHDTRSYSTNAHYRTSAGNKQAGVQWLRSIEDLSAGMHTYSVDWQPERLDFYFDGKLVRSVTDKAAVPQVPLYLLVNLAVGGSWPNNANKPINSATQLPASMQINSVKVWSRRV